MLCVLHASSCFEGLPAFSLTPCRPQHLAVLRRDDEMSVLLLQVNIMRTARPLCGQAAAALCHCPPHSTPFPFPFRYRVAPMLSSQTVTAKTRSVSRRNGNARSCSAIWKGERTVPRYEAQFFCFAARNCRPPHVFPAIRCCGAFRKPGNK